MADLYSRLKKYNNVLTSEAGTFPPLLRCWRLINPALNTEKGDPDVYCTISDDLYLSTTSLPRAGPVSAASPTCTSAGRSRPGITERSGGRREILGSTHHPGPHSDPFWHKNHRKTLACSDIVRNSSFAGRRGEKKN